MTANVIGLIEIDTTPAASRQVVCNDEGPTPTLKLFSPSDDATEPSRETIFLRADLHQLQQELDSAFVELMQRLLQGD